MKTISQNTALRYSRQRVKILELLRSTDIHPTADWIYQEIKKSFPNLSLGTIYRNLAILVEQGQVQKIQYGSTFDRFEARVEPHYHLICTRCGSICDLELPVYRDLDDRAGQLTDFEIHGHRIDFYGLCSACRPPKPANRS